MQWPPYSPDLNPIENLWAVMARRLELLQPSSKDEMICGLKSIWDNITSQELLPYVLSMPTRLQQVVYRQWGRSDY